MKVVVGHSTELFCKLGVTEGDFRLAVRLSQSPFFFSLVGENERLLVARDFVAKNKEV